MNVYECTFNWKGEVHTLFTSALSKPHAKGNTLKRLSILLEVGIGVLKKEYDGHADNYKVVER